MAFHPEAFGKYYLVDKIAIGGMAEIFKAKQFGPGGFEKVLVIKRILSHLSEDHDFVEMFHDEAMISSKLSHSNIVHVYEFGKIRNNYFIAMEYCEGKDLKTAMKKCQEIGRPLPIEYAVYVIHEVCKGLDYAHRKRDENNQEMNILHRDISPSNIIISYDEGEVKIADFGIAKAQDTTYHTKAGVLKGKFEYMSPEQASGLSVDRRSDVYACGISFYEILTRRRLFKTESDLKTLELIKNPLIPPPSHLNPQVSRDLDAIVMKALARNPDERYQEAWQMQHDLREYMRSSSPPTSPDLIALSLANFMRDIFAREIKRERERLEAGTRIARELMLSRGEPTEDYETEENWDIPSGNSRVAPITDDGSTNVRLMIEEKERSSYQRSVLIVLGVVALVVFGGLLLLNGLSSRDSASGEGNVRVLDTDAQSDRPGSDVLGESGPRTTLELDTQPRGARVYIGGALVGTSPIKYRRLEPDSVVELRIEYGGYKKYVDSLYTPPGSKTVVRKVELVPLKKAGQTPRPFVKSGSSARAKEEPSVREPVVAVPTGQLYFVSNPSNATVAVNGKVLCQTPCRFRDGLAEQTYTISFSREGYETRQTSVRYPAQGVARVEEALKPLEMGRLKLTIKDGLSAEISIDGDQRGHSSAYYSLEVAPGRRKITLRNQLAGYEKTLWVEISPGQETKVLDVDLTE